MRRLLVTCILLFAATAASAAGTGAPVYWRGDGFDAVLKAGDKPIAVTVGDTPLHAPVTFRCRSTVGCVVALDATDIDIDTAGTYLCGTVDSQPMLPGCSSGPGIGGGTVLNGIHQQKRVTPGTHTLTLIYHSDNTKGTISAWEAEYRIYQRGIE
ncbi:MAG TPA: hypothetical protein VFV07_02185 [Rhizomicrobium sp.]|nr:hypothetical protein [Rhizomicrobium sp.]